MGRTGSGFNTSKFPDRMETSVISSFTGKVEKRQGTLNLLDVAFVDLAACVVNKVSRLSEGSTSGPLRSDTSKGRPVHRLNLINLLTTSYSIHRIPTGLLF